MGTSSARSWCSSPLEQDNAVTPMQDSGLPTACVSPADAAARAQGGASTLAHARSNLPVMTMLHQGPEALSPVEAPPLIPC